MTIASFHLTRYPRDQRLSAASRMWFDRAELRAVSGLRFWRLLGTARGQSLSLSADLDRWAMFAVWENPDALEEFTQTSPIARGWAETADETCTVELQFISGHGRWNNSFPFKAPEQGSAPPVGPLAVLTRAAVRPTQLWRFYRAIPDIDRALADQPGLWHSVGIGEWPVARQATFSIWDDADAMTAFAYRQRNHRDVIKRTRDQAWFREEMFCRFTVVGATGTWNGLPVIPPPLTA